MDIPRPTRGPTGPCWVKVETTQGERVFWLDEGGALRLGPGGPMAKQAAAAVAAGARCVWVSS